MGAAEETAKISILFLSKITLTGDDLPKCWSCICVLYHVGGTDQHLVEAVGRAHTRLVIFSISGFLRGNFRNLLRLHGHKL